MCICVGVSAVFRCGREAAEGRGCLWGCWGGGG